MKKWIFLSFFAPVFLTACIQPAPLNPEADILTFSFPESGLRNEAEIYNDYIIVYPKNNVNLRDSAYQMTITAGATSEEWANPSTVSDTLSYVKVTSEDKRYSKTYSIIQVRDFPEVFDFETWQKASPGYLYENPIDGSLQWYSSNNGAAIAWNSPSRPASEYLVRKTNVAVTGNTAVELVTMVGPGSIAGGIRYIPCLAGSLYLGGFDILTGLTNPLKSTKFGVPFNAGLPVKFTGYYMYQEGTEDFINADGSRDAMRHDTCAFYATLFKTDKDVQYLYGDDVSTSKNIIARAQMKPGEIKQGTTYIPFELEFDYNSFSTPFVSSELLNNEYKMTIVFASSNRGAYYEGRPGSRLLIDNVRLVYHEIK